MRTMKRVKEALRWRMHHGVEDVVARPLGEKAHGWLNNLAVPNGSRYLRRFVPAPQAHMHLAP